MKSDNKKVNGDIRDENKIYVCPMYLHGKAEDHCHIANLYSY